MQSIPDSCFIAPDSLFFAKILDADKSLSDADARSVAENYLEAEAPLALEQMMWCFWRAGGKILICAASAERVAAFDADAKRLETAKAAFPLMAAVFAARLENGRYFYKSGGGASSFSVENGEVAEISVSDSAPGAGEAGLGREIEISISESASSLKFSAVFAGGNACAGKWKISKAAVKKKLDIRPPQLLLEISKAARRAALARAFFAAAACLFVFLAAWQCRVFWKKLELAKIERGYAAIADRAKAVEAMGEQLAFLASFSKTPMMNVKLLALANGVRSRDIEFSKTVFSAPNELRVSGKAESAGSVGRFEEALAALPQVRSVKANIPSSKSGNAQFEILISFKN